ncbi:MAG TPA: enoyl-CoA hydratase-related protein [Noviherbaspirillum sp.]|nr:enoyl-CoA hydratase-related protein [Noviherbaspirillum sp.]
MEHELVNVGIDDGIAVLRLNRPEARNALSRALTGQLDAHLQAVERRDDVRVIVLCAEGEHFAAGADVREMHNMDQAQVLLADFAGCSRHLACVAMPVIAAVDGCVLGGGCELVEMCDIVIASERSSFGHPEFMLGTMPGAGGTQRLPRVLGKHLAMDLFLTGRRLGAQEAQQHGLVSRVVPAEELMPLALQLARAIAACSAPVARLIKQAVQAGLQDRESTGLALERALFQQSFALADRAEGMAAFVEKRKPKFRHR